MPYTKVPVPGRIELMIVGAQKAGTTSLKNYLGEHPALQTHPQKELAFFYDDREFARGWSRARSKYFKGMSGKHIIAKNAGLYIRERGLERLSIHNPGCRIVFILRDPVERTFSAFNMETNYGSLKEPFDSIVDVVKRGDPYDWRFDLLIGMSDYYSHLQKIYTFFPEENVKLIRYEDLKRNAEKVCRNIFRFMQVDDTFTPDISRKYNVTVRTRSAVLSRMTNAVLNNRSILKKAAKLIVPKNRAYKLNEMIRNANRTNETYGPMRPETEKFLRAYFAPGIEKLSGLTGMNFSEWTNTQITETDGV